MVGANISVLAWLNLSTDLSMAFDGIDHMTLLRKLEYHGIRGHELKLIESYLTNRLQFVEIDTVRSSLIHCLPCSCIQGSKMAGTFYNLYGLEVPLLHKVMAKPESLYALISQPRLQNGFPKNFPATAVGNRSGPNVANVCPPPPTLPYTVNSPNMRAFGLGKSNHGRGRAGRGQEGYGLIGEGRIIPRRLMGRMQ